MAEAASRLPGSSVYRGDLSVRVIAVYRDSRHFWYRTSAELRYLPAQHRLEFGACNVEAIGFIGSDKLVAAASCIGAEGGNGLPMEAMDRTGPKPRTVDDPEAHQVKEEVASRDAEPDPKSALANAADEIFQAGAQRRNEQYLKAKTAAIALGDSRRDIDLLALTRCEIDRIRTDTEAWVSAWLGASERSGFSLASWAEGVLADTANQLTNASVASFTTELASLFHDRKIPMSGEAFCEQTIRKGAESALQPASLRLRDHGLRIAHKQMQEFLGEIKVTPVREFEPWPGEIIVERFQSPPPTSRPVEDAIRLFEASPEFPATQVWIHDRMRRLTASLKGDYRVYGSKPRVRLALGNLNIRAAAFLRLVSNIEKQNAFMVLLDELELFAWIDFIGVVPTNILAGAPTIAAGIERRKRWWRRQGYRHLANLSAAAPSEIAVNAKHEQPVRGDRKPVNIVETGSQQQNDESELSSPTTARRSVARNTASDNPALFRKSGQVWELGFYGTTVHLPHTKGLGYIAELLRMPHEAIEAAVLAGISIETTKLRSASGMPLSNPRTIKAVRAELADKKAQFERLQPTDWARRGEIEEQIQKLERYISQTTTLRKQVRKVGATAERARTSVTNAVNRAIKDISQAYPDLGMHLENSIRTGITLTYAPRVTPDWQF